MPKFLISILIASVFSISAFAKPLPTSPVQTDQTVSSYDQLILSQDQPVISQDQPVISQISYICLITPTLWCWQPYPAPIGYPCWCFGYSGYVVP